MTGRLGTNWRSGNLAENLGILLLRGIAAVADVPRPEDIGLDAVATLLRRDKDRNCYAEDTFGVQIKSWSAETIEYRDHSLTWLVRQSEPFFIGRVSLPDAKIALYPTLFVNHAVRAMHATTAVIHFGDSAIPSIFEGHPNNPWGGRQSQRDTVDVWVGNPLLEWTLKDLRDDGFLSLAYRTLKEFLKVAKREHLLLSLGQASAVRWTTNSPDSINTSFMMGILGTPSSDDLQSVVDACLPALQKLLIFSVGLNDDRRKVLHPLIELVAALKEMGATLETEDLFFKLGAYRLVSSNAPREDI